MVPVMVEVIVWRGSDAADGREGAVQGPRVWRQGRQGRQGPGRLLPGGTRSGPWHATLSCAVQPPPTQPCVPSYLGPQAHRDSLSFQLEAVPVRWCVACEAVHRVEAFNGDEKTCRLKRWVGRGVGGPAAAALRWPAPRVPLRGQRTAGSPPRRCGGVSQGAFVSLPPPPAARPPARARSGGGRRRRTRRRRRDDSTMGGQGGSTQHADGTGADAVNSALRSRCELNAHAGVARCTRPRAPDPQVTSWAGLFDADLPDPHL